MATARRSSCRSPTLPFPILLRLASLPNQAKGQTQRYSQISDPSMESFAVALLPNFFHLRGWIFRTAIRTVALLATIPNNGLPTPRLHKRDVQKCVLPVFAARTQHRGVFWMSRAFSLPGNAYDLAPASRKLAPCQFLPDR